VRRCGVSAALAVRGGLAESGVLDGSTAVRGFPWSAVVDRRGTRQIESMSLRNAPLRDLHFIRRDRAALGLQASVAKLFVVSSTTVNWS